jgi:hypothetical protein
MHSFVILLISILRICFIVGEPFFGVNLVLEGLLGNPNPSANLIGVLQAQIHYIMVFTLCCACKQVGRRSPLVGGDFNRYYLKNQHCFSSRIYRRQISNLSKVA